LPNGCQLFLLQHNSMQPLYLHELLIGLGRHAIYNLRFNIHSNWLIDDGLKLIFRYADNELGKLVFLSFYRYGTSVFLYNFLA